jgi:hypothetical protein
MRPGGPRAVDPWLRRCAWPLERRDGLDPVILHLGVDATPDRRSGVIEFEILVGDFLDSLNGFDELGE